MGIQDRDWDREGGGGQSVFSALCNSCGHSFRVRIPQDFSENKSYSISYRCPKCGRQYTITNGEIRQRGGQNAGNAGRPKKDIFKILLYVILIPCIILLVGTIALLIAGIFVDVSPVFKGIHDGFVRVFHREMDIQAFMTFMTRIFVIVVCFPVHESAHAWVAGLLGDDTGRARGRVSLNPFRHLDLIGTLMIFLLGVGYAKPVPVNINRFKHRKRDFALTAIAGPISNLLMAIIFLFILKFLIPAIASSQYGQVLLQALIYASFINVSLAVFNLIPIPPLDGSRVVSAFLPDDMYDWVLKSGQAAVVVLFVAIMVMNRMGVSPIGQLSSMVFQALYGWIV